MGKQTVTDKMEEISDNYCKSVSLKFSYHNHSWMAECLDLKVQSIVGPMQVLEDLEVKLRESKHSKDPTKLMPAVGGNNGKDEDGQVS